MGLGILVAAAAGTTGQYWIAFAYNASVLLIAWLSTKVGARGSSLKVSRRHDAVLSIRMANVVTLSLENDGNQPIRGRLRDEAPEDFLASQREFDFQLEPGERKELIYTLTPFERGSDHFRGTFVRVDCPFGLAQSESRIPNEDLVRVYPNVLALRQFDLLKQRGRLRDAGIRRTRMRGLGSDFESLRDYADGDDYRKIDWKATARRDRPTVRQFEVERNQAVIVCIDVGRLMLAEVDGVRKLDRALDACLMLLHAAADGGDLIGLLVYADTVQRYVPPRKGRNQVGAIIEALHDLIAEPVATDHIAAFSYLSSRWKRRALLVVFTDLDDAEGARHLTTGMLPLSRRHLTLLARVRDPKLDEAQRRKPNSIRDLYTRAAAELLMEDRRAAAKVLDAAGLHTLEAEPDDLAKALVSYYFLVKERSLL
jgi:uncharacterized protein (DUF58 family)